MKMPKKMQKKGNALNGVVGAFVGLLFVGMIVTFLYSFFSIVLDMDVVTTPHAVNDTNTSDQIEAVRTAADIGIDFLPIVILGAIMFALLGYFIGKKFNT